MQALRIARDDNIIKCDQAYYYDGSLYLVYELFWNAVTLDQVMVHGDLLGSLCGQEIATICVGLLKGIKYIHESLHMIHGFITKHTVFLNSDGQVKIGESRLHVM